MSFIFKEEDIPETPSTDGEGDGATGNLGGTRVHKTIEKWSFEDFTSKLKDLRDSGSSILNSISPDSHEISKLENYKECTKNFQKRLDLLKEFTRETNKEIVKVKNEIEKSVQQQQQTDPNIKYVATEQKRSTLKNLELFKEAIAAEKQREEYYKAKAVEMYLAKYLNVAVIQTQE